MYRRIIGRRIKFYRNKLGLTQAQLAEKLDVSAKYVSSIERGESNVSLNKLDKIAKTLNTDLASLISDCDSESSNFPLSDILTLTKDWSSVQKDHLISLVQILDIIIKK